MPAFLTGLDTNTWLLIAAGVYLLLMHLPDTSPIKQFVQKIFGPILGPIIGPQPTPGPTPGPVPAPGPVDLNSFLQLLMSLLLKAKASGDTKTQEAILATIDAVQTEQMAMQKNALAAVR